MHHEPMSEASEADNARRPRSHRRLGRLAWLAFPATLAACGGAGDIAGRLGATELGDLSNPPAERVVARTPLAESCGPATVPADPGFSFVRAPYLQRVGSSSADLLWVSGADRTLAPVLWTPDGTNLDPPSPVGDPSAQVPGGAAQWIAPVEGLVPSTVYCYELRDGASSTVRGAFRTPPSPGGTRRSGSWRSETPAT